MHKGNTLIGILIAVALALVPLMGSAVGIGHIDRDGSWFYIYDETGRRITSFSRTRGELQGYSSEFIILKSGSWYYLYDAHGRRINSLSVSHIGEILSVGRDTFTSRSGSWIYTWSKDGRRLASRAAHTVK